MTKRHTAPHYMYSALHVQLPAIKPIDVRCAGDRVSQEEGGSKFGIFGTSNRGASILDSFRRPILLLDDAEGSNEVEERKYGRMPASWMGTDG